MAVTFNSKIASAAHDGSLFHIGIAHGDGTYSRRDSEALLFCIGRVPNSDNIGIQNTDLKPTARGYIETDDHLRTPVEGVYAMGDIAGRYMFTHAANFESEYLGEQIAENRDEPIDYGPMPHAIFTSPEIAGGQIEKGFGQYRQSDRSEFVYNRDPMCQSRRICSFFCVRFNRNPAQVRQGATPQQR